MQILQHKSTCAITILGNELLNKFKESNVERLPLSVYNRTLSDLKNNRQKLAYFTN